MTAIGFDTALTASQWAILLDAPNGPLRSVLRATYGPQAAPYTERLALFQAVLRDYLKRFGDGPVRLFRASGRINLRGMHVDTHGGCLNLMTHQREVVVVLGSAAEGEYHFANCDLAFEEVRFPIEHVPNGMTWSAFIHQSDSVAALRENPGHWAHYLRGCCLRVQHARPSQTMEPLQGVFGGDLPLGAALSSSAALCMALINGLGDVNGLALQPCECIRAAREAEWYAGARVGPSDPAAIALGRRGELVSVTLDGARLEDATPRWIPFPDELAVLVVHSHTRRSLSGQQAVEYATNRLAYSIALDVARQTLRARTGTPADHLAGLADLAPCPDGPIPDAASFYRLLLHIPEKISIDDLRARYAPPGLDAAWELYFGSVPEDRQPQTLQLRGPLLFGVAESERAQLFSKAMEQGHFREAGRLMSCGHDGDRRIDGKGAPFRVEISDAALHQMAERNMPVSECPGAYGASSPALDRLVDAALVSGALGASLTGAGIAGSIVVLCEATTVRPIMHGLIRCLSSAEYASIAGLSTPLDPAQAAASIVINQAPAGAGELTLTDYPS